MFFRKDRNTSPLKFYICAGFGRTGTVSISELTKHNHTWSMHFSVRRQYRATAAPRAGGTQPFVTPPLRAVPRPPCTQSPVRLLPECDVEGDYSFDRIVAHDFNTTVPRRPDRARHMKFEPGRLAFADNPTGFYAWDIMDAFPDYEVGRLHTAASAALCRRVAALSRCPPPPPSAPLPPPPPDVDTSPAVLTSCTARRHFALLSQVALTVREVHDASCAFTCAGVAGC